MRTPDHCDDCKKHINDICDCLCHFCEHIDYYNTSESAIWCLGCGRQSDAKEKDWYYPRAIWDQSRYYNQGYCEIDYEAQR